MFTIRPECPADIAAIHSLNEAAFGQPLEAEIVDALRNNCPDLLSLVAFEGDELLGHILFSPVTLVAGERRLLGMGLAPMAVAPDHQRQGIGSALVREGLARLDAGGCLLVSVLGHPAFYPRFGFVPASRYAVVPQWEGVPDEAFMLRVFDTQVLSGVTGTLYYRAEFDLA